MFELELLQCLGYFPDRHVDAINGQPILAEGRYQFVVNSGFVGCHNCAPDSFAGQAVLDWNQGDYHQESVLRLAKSALRSTIDFNLQGKSLKSREVYAQMMRRK